MTGDAYGGLRQEPMVCSGGMSLSDMWFDGYEDLMRTTAEAYTALEVSGLNPRVSSRCRRISDVGTEIFVSSVLWVDEADQATADKIAQFAGELGHAVKESDRVEHTRPYSHQYDAYLLTGSSGKIARVHVRIDDGKKQPENRVLDQILASF